MIITSKGNQARSKRPKEGRESEIVADDIDHALNIQKSWIDKGANYVEIFRVFEYDGSLNPTIGAYRKGA